ncbi:VOC family protein [Burkholderia cepacia]|uniref:VOC family protein n=1 Tax=Burkholderia cepacia TaxID=292 RepID=UPI000B2A0568|nr:VOC family protein [Burkholderia cepacia]
MNDPVLGPIDQIGYVVADLDRSIARWRERHGIGPWTVFRKVRLTAIISASRCRSR